MVDKTKEDCKKLLKDICFVIEHDLNIKDYNLLWYQFKAIDNYIVDSIIIHKE